MINFRTIILFLLCFFSSPVEAKVNEIAWNTGIPVSLYIPKDARPVLYTASEILSSDFEKVLGAKTVKTERSMTADIAVEINPEKVSRTQGFSIRVSDDGRLLICAHDNHGAAYALMEISRLLGVSPWEWWADCVPAEKNKIVIPGNYSAEMSPSVEYRGIFINDEDWGLMPWSCQNHEPAERGVIGPKTTARIFELLLRLRANTYWPPMHECSVPFFLVSGNREMAEKYGIYIGGSHCEPMASSTAGEWPRRGVGEYDYVSNSDNVKSFWETRLNDVTDQEIIYTLGMRGVHDGAMKGASGVNQQKEVLAKVISDQREMLERHGIGNAPQVFIPYKEVLDIYNAGLEVPEDVTLMWCDDNYGYIRHFPDSIERKRKGGNGIYYHVSYWGRPHDYLWLGTFSPGLLYQQMNEAYNRGIDRMWILNVGDIKPAEYQIELFMDMAWDIDAVRNKGIRTHLADFLKREFGEETGSQLLPIMNKHYNLAFIRKPEFLGNTRCEEYGPGSEKWGIVSDLSWSDEYISKRIEDYQQLSDKVEKINQDIAPSMLDTYFQLIKYPVQAAAEMNKKMLFGQLARHGKNTWVQSQQAYDSIVALTETYNKGICNKGKWNSIMDFQPRKQPVFEPLTPCDPYEEPYLCKSQIINACDHYNNRIIKHIGLGASDCAIEIPKGKSMEFNLGSSDKDSVTVVFNFLPNHPIVESEGLRCAVSLNDGRRLEFDYATKGRSEEWKNNILNGKASRKLVFPSLRMTDDILRIESLTDGIILDYIEILQ